MPLLFNSWPFLAFSLHSLTDAILFFTFPLLILASSAIPSHCTSLHILCPDLLFFSLAIQPVTPLFYAIAKICRSAPCRSPSTQRFSLPSLIMPTRCYYFATLCSSILCLSLAFHFSTSPFHSDAIPAMPLRLEFY